MIKYGVTAVLCAIVAYLTVRKVAPGKLECAPNATFTKFARAEDVPNFSLFSAATQKKLRDQIGKFGGTCMAKVAVSSIEDTDGGVQEDPVLILHPWQLP